MFIGVLVDGTEFLSEHEARREALRKAVNPLGTVHRARRIDAEGAGDRMSGRLRGSDALRGLEAATRYASSADGSTRMALDTRM